MEVLYRNQPVFGAQPAAGMVYPQASASFSNALSPRMFATPSEAYTCYQFQSSIRSPHTPSRTPTPEYPTESTSNESAGMFRGNTLKSVLRGEVPEAYSHFLSDTNNGSRSDSPRRHSPLLGKRRSPFVESEVSSPAVLGRSPTTVLSPPPEDMQTEPMDLSFKRPCSAESSGSSSPASFHHTFPPSPAEDHLGSGSSEFSLLRNLLQVGKFQQNIHQALPSSSYYSSSPSASSATSDRSCDSPCSDNGVLSQNTGRHLCGSTRVTLAKKNMYPVLSRVQDWLLKAVQFAKSCGYFQHLPRSDRGTLLLNAWSRLLLLFMAESNLQFATTPLRSEPLTLEGQADESPSPDEPTVKSVESIQAFIRKCQTMNLDTDEYHFMRMLVLFNSSYVGLAEPSTVDSFNSHIQQSLQQHVQNTRPADFMHYSRLLMSLPSLYGISAKMVENLFCKQVLRNASCQDMDVYLKDLLASSTSSSAQSA